jgi:hypothetical protein
VYADSPPSARRRALAGHSIVGRSDTAARPLGRASIPVPTRVFMREKVTPTTDDAVSSPSRAAAEEAAAEGSLLPDDDCDDEDGDAPPS